MFYTFYQLLIEKIMMHKWLKYILYYIQVESYRIDYEKNKTYILSKSTAFSRIYNKIYDHSNKFISRLCNMNMHKSTLLSKSKLTTKVDPTLSMQNTTQTLQSFTSNLNTRWRYKIKPRHSTNIGRLQTNLSSEYFRRKPFDAHKRHVRYFLFTLGDK